MKKYVHDFRVLQNRQVNNDHFILVLECPVELPQVLPGQFVEARIDHSPNTFLRRPLSVHDIDYKANTLSLLIQKKGEGTHMLSTLDEGKILNIVYPLGNSFKLTNGEKALLVGGGCGIAPLLYLAKYLGNYGKKVSILMGGRTSAHIMESEIYKAYGELLITTEDGSLGKKGFVIHHPVWWEGKFDYDVIYTCGPDPMMKAVAKLAAKHGIPCQVSLEQTMACGIGACLCCVVETTNGHKCTCTEGPVFDYQDLKGWKPE